MLKTPESSAVLTEYKKLNFWFRVKLICTVNFHYIACKESTEIMFVELLSG